MTGLAFGIVTSMQNLACAVIPLIVADIYTKSGDAYIPNVEFLFVGLASIGVIVGVYMNIYDYNHGGVLNSPYVADADHEKELKNPLLEGDDSTPDEQRDKFNANEDDTKTIHFANPAGDVIRTISREGFQGERTSSTASNSDHHLHHRGSRHSRHSRNGSFSSYEEITRAGVFRTSGQHVHH